MAAAECRAKLIKPIQARKKYHSCISYHDCKAHSDVVKDLIVKKLEKLQFEIEEVSCIKSLDDFSKSLEESDAWVQVLTDECKDCRQCESFYKMFTDTRLKTKTKELQKLIQVPQQGNTQIWLRIHSDYSADVDAFCGLKTFWLYDLQLAIITRFHAFLSYHKSDENLAEKIIKWLEEKGYLVTHRGKFLSAKDAKEKAVKDKMSDKIISLISVSYLKDPRDFDLVKPVVTDRGWIPVVVEWSNSIENFLDYHPKVVLVMSAHKNDEQQKEKFEKAMEKIQSGIDNPDGLPSDCGTARRDGPPNILPYQIIKRVVHSVGKIRVKIDSHSSDELHGTGFCVGKKETTENEKRYVFTAYHVVGDKIDNMIRMLVKSCGNEAKTLLEKIGFRSEEFEYFNKDVYHYRQNEAGELKFTDYTRVENKEKIFNMWRDLSIDFLSEENVQEKFHFEMDIPFMSQKHDAILLMLTKSKDYNFPEPLQLDLDIDKFWHLAGCEANQDIANIVIAAWCPVFDGHSFHDSSCWWSRRKMDPEQLKEIHSQFGDLDSLGQIPFKCTEHFKGGCSGSPCWCVKGSSVLVVQGLYLGCLPDVYFSKTEEKPKDLAFRHRPERALPMKEIFEILKNSNLNLINDIGLKK